VGARRSSHYLLLRRGVVPHDTTIDADIDCSGFAALRLRTSRVRRCGGSLWCCSRQSEQRRRSRTKGSPRRQLRALGTERHPRESEQRRRSRTKGSPRRQLRALKPAMQRQRASASRGPLSLHGAGGIRTPVPIRPAHRVYKCVRAFNLTKVIRARRAPNLGQPRCSLVPLRPGGALEPTRFLARANPTGCRVYSASPRIRRRERTACWQLLFCILFTWPGCSTTRNDGPVASGRIWSAPIVKDWLERPSRAETKYTPAPRAIKPWLLTLYACDSLRCTQQLCNTPQVSDS